MRCKRVNAVAANFFARKKAPDTCPVHPCVDFKPPEGVAAFANRPFKNVAYCIHGNIIPYMGLKVKPIFLCAAFGALVPCMTACLRKK